MKVRGNTKKILETVGEIQMLIESAIANDHNDQDPHQKTKVQNDLDAARRLCHKIRNMYDPT